jgi:heme-degrading monooxygenase HmoA
MPTLPWHELAPVEPERSYTAVLGHLQLESFLMLPGFVWHTRRIEKQLQRTKGLIGYRLRANFLARKFFHLSVWESDAAVQTFVHADPHVQIMEKLVGRLGKTEFRYWTVKGSDLPRVFEPELHRLGK